MNSKSAKMTCSKPGEDPDVVCLAWYVAGHPGLERVGEPIRRPPTCKISSRSLSLLLATDAVETVVGAKNLRRHAESCGQRFGLYAVLDREQSGLVAVAQRSVRLLAGGRRRLAHALAERQVWVSGAVEVEHGSAAPVSPSSTSAQSSTCQSRAPAPTSCASPASGPPATGWNCAVRSTTPS
jgi:hypothetical protein